MTSNDARRWTPPRRMERQEDGRIKQQVADALWDLAEKGYEVEIQYECHEEKRSFYAERICYPVVLLNGTKVEQPADCRTAEECADAMLQLYKLAKEPPPPPPPDPREVEAEQLLKEWPELEVFGMEWVKSWIHIKKRLASIAELIRRCPWIKTMISKGFGPFSIRAYVARDETEVCISLDPFKEAYCCSSDGKRRAELELKGSEPYEGGAREVYRPRGLLAFTAKAKEYVRIL